MCAFLGAAPDPDGILIVRSSSSTSSAARARVQASGLPPNIAPCSPECSKPVTWLFDSLADTG